MKKVIPFFLLHSCSIACIFGQLNNCGNIGFEQGNFVGWKLSNGKLNDRIMPKFYNEVSGTFKDGHLITNLSMGNDPLIKIETIPMVALGSKYSARIGNDDNGSRFDKISTSFLVGSDNSLFQYKFAIILQDPNHPKEQQPAFSIKIYTASNSNIPCGYYEVSAGRGISGFKEQPAGPNGQKKLTFRNWTTGAIDLRKFVGQTITIEVMSTDCTENGHFGYCYFDAQCFKSEIISSTFCPSVDSTITLSAPDGFEKYTWNTGENTSKIKIKPQIGKKYNVKLQPFSSLNEFCELTMEYNLNSTTSSINQEIVICEGESFAVGDTTYKTSGIYTKKIKRNGLCDSIVTTKLIVRPIPKFNQIVTICEGESFAVDDTTYKISGVYINRFTRNGLCDSIVNTNLTVKPFSRFNQNIIICEGDSYSVGDTTYKTTGTYLKRIKRNGLCDSLITTNLTVKALTKYSQNIVICEGESFSVGDTTYKTSGTYLKRIKRNSLCDSLITTNLTVKVLTKYSQNIVICEGESFSVGDTTYKTIGTYLKRIKRNGICDSLVTTNLSVTKVNLSIPKSVYLELGDSVLVVSVIEPVGLYKYSWSPNLNLSCPLCPSTWIKPNNSNVYTLSVENLNQGCKKQQSISINVKPCQIYLPNAFTPNDDGTNDTFFPYSGKCVNSILSFSIFNRWGEIIFSRENFSPSISTFGWDGKYKGEIVKPDSYAYRLKVEFINNEIYEKSGSITVFR